MRDVASFGWFSSLEVATVVSLDHGQFVELKQGRVLALLAVTSLAFLGTYTLYTYISPALRDATDGNESLLTLILLAWGVGILAGNITAGRLVDRHDSARVLTGALTLATLALVLTPLATRALASTLVWAVVWGATVGVIVVPQQHRLISLSPAAAPVLLGLNSSALYIGIALSGGFGGLAQKWLGLAPAELGPVAAGITALTLLWHLGTTRRPTAPAPTTPEPTSADSEKSEA